MSDLAPVIIDGKVIGFQWEHIWFVEEDKMVPMVDIYRKVYVEAGGLTFIRPDNKEKYYEVKDPDSIVSWFTTRIEELVNL